MLFQLISLAYLSLPLDEAIPSAQNPCHSMEKVDIMSKNFPVPSMYILKTLLQGYLVFYLNRVSLA